MELWRRTGAALVAVLAGACAGPGGAGRTVAPRAERAPPGSDLVVAGGRIWPDALAEAPVEALLVRDGRVVAAGTRAEIEGLALADARVLDLAGGVAVPGLQDAHGHLASLGESLESVDLHGATAYAEVVERVRARAQALPPGAWVTGRGWDQTLWPGGAFPHHAPLSRAVPDHPVLVRRVDGHAALANAAALALAGLDRAPAPEVEAGRVLAGDDGLPTGVLVDGAMELVARHRPPPDGAVLRRRLLAAQEAVLAAGLTCVHDMGLSPAALAKLEALEAEGLWELRVKGYVWANDGLPEGLEGPAREARAPDRRPPRVELVGAKLMLDGALGSRGAALLADYADAPGERGHLLVAPETFRALLDAVADAGLQPATHAIGDRANRVLLDACEARLARDPSLAELRPRVEHAQVVAPPDLGRFAELGIVVSMQPTHATSDMRWAEERLGGERLAGAYAWRRLVDDPVTLALGSDFPVESCDPLLGLHAARARCDAEGRPPGGWLPDQRLDAREALAGFTRGAARAVREEGVRGTLRPGAFADLTVLDVDPLEAPAEELLEARVLLTVIEGEVVHRRGNG